MKAEVCAELLHCINTIKYCWLLLYYKEMDDGVLDLKIPQRLILKQGYTYIFIRVRLI